MLSLRDGASMKSAANSLTDPHLRKLLSQRMNQLSRYYEGDLGELAHFLIIEPGDSQREITAELGFSPLKNLSDGSCFGDAEFTPSWEWMQCHGDWYELVFILSDDGFGSVVFIPNHLGIEFDLHSLCLEYAACSTSRVPF